MTAMPDLSYISEGGEGSTELAVVEDDGWNGPVLEGYVAPYRLCCGSLTVSIHAACEKSHQHRPYRLVPCITQSHLQSLSLRFLPHRRPGTLLHHRRHARPAH